MFISNCQEVMTGKSTGTERIRNAFNKEEIETICRILEELEKRTGEAIGNTKTSHR